MRLVILRYLHFHLHFIDAIKSELLTLTFQSDIVRIWVHIKLSPFYYKVNALKTWDLHLYPPLFIYHNYPIIMVSLFLALHDQYFIMFKDSNVFEFTNFPFKTKYNNTVVYSVNSNYLFLREKQGKKCWNLIKSTIYLLIFCQNSMIFEGSSNSLRSLISPED